jgi:hypothetical protein
MNYGNVDKNSHKEEKRKIQLTIFYIKMNYFDNKPPTIYKQNNISKKFQIDYLLISILLITILI